MTKLVELLSREDIDRGWRIHANGENLLVLPMPPDGERASACVKQQPAPFESFYEVWIVAPRAEWYYETDGPLPAVLKEAEETLERLGGTVNWRN